MKNSQTRFNLTNGILPIRHSVFAMAHLPREMMVPAYPVNYYHVALLTKLTAIVPAPYY
jgi:hypothetical protein